MKPTDIIMVVAQHYGLSPEELTGKSRKQYIVLARHIAMYLIRTELRYSFQSTASAFGVTHYVPMCATEKIHDWISIYPDIAAAVKTIQTNLLSNAAH